MLNEKLKQYLDIKSDPALALMHMINRHEKEMEGYMTEHKKEMEEYMEKCDKRMAEMLEKQVKEKINTLKEGDILNADFIQIYPNTYKYIQGGPG